MKNLIYALIVVSLWACKSGPKDKKVNAQTHLNSTELISVNGISEADAFQMVRDFKADSTSLDPNTSFWFDLKFIDSITKAATTSSNKVDGVRIHMGKRGGKNTIVMLFTTDAGPHPTEPGKKIHQEFFSPSRTPLTSIYVRNVDEHYRPKGANLSLQGVCPIQEECNNRDPHYIDCKTANSWSRAFANAHGTQPFKINTRSIWFPLSIFSTIKRDILTGKGDGFRLYLAVKPNGRVTFILVPTVSKLGGIHQDIYTCYAEKFREEYNRGEECPTFCNGFVLPDSIP